MFALYTYIAPSLDVFMQASPQTITLMLVLIGIGFSIGNHLGGKFADLSLEKTLIGFLVLFMVMKPKLVKPLNSVVSIVKIFFSPQKFGRKITQQKN